MKRLITVFFSLIAGTSLFAQNNVIYVNNGGILTAENHGVITSAIPIDATAFLNRGTFTNVFTSEFGYTMSNVRFFTNRGRMTGSVGFHLDTIDTAAGARRPMASFLNDNNASITATDTGLDPVDFGNFFFNSLSSATVSLLKVNATNLVNRGNLSVGNVGLMKLTGKTVDLARGSVVAGEISGVDTNLDDFLFSFFDLNSYGVEDIYGGAGEQTINLDPTALAFNSLGYFPPLAVFSPFHGVQFRSPPGGFGTGGFILNAQVALPQTFPADFEVHTFITQRPTPRGIDKQIQVVFVKTNFTDTNISAEVRFGPSDVTVNPFAQTVFVQFSTKDLDPVTGNTNATNAFYFIDSSAEFGAIFAITNIFANSSVRPSSYRILTSTPATWPFAVTNNTVYDPFLIFPGNTYEDDVVDAQYAGYAAKIGRNPELSTGLSTFTNALNINFGTGLSFSNLDQLILFPDPTNQAGRIEINADTLDLTLSRIRAEGLLSINAKHLKPGGAFDVSAGIINADLGSTNGSMTISNVFPSHFKRVRGDVYAYSAIWSNTETNTGPGSFTNNNQFHVLILDHNLQADFKPTIRHLALRSTNLVVKDDLSINRSALFATENLTFGGVKPDGGSNTITLSEDAVNLRAANLVGLKNFLNESNSTFQGADTAYFGYDTPSGLISFTNLGMITATAPLFKTANFHNSGTIIADNGGSITLQAGVADLCNGTNLADSGIDISVGTLIVTNSTLTAGGFDLLGQPQFGRLVLNVTNRITDFGTNANNIWEVSDGFELSRKPSLGDLLGTQIRTIATGFNEVQHIWAGQDRGSGPDGFVNNVALGHLILDIQTPTAKLRFAGIPGSRNALYVRTLDFNVGTNVDINTDLNNLMQIEANMTIYYIDSNAADKLTNAFPGRVIQVPDFALAGGMTPLTLRANGLGIIKPNLDGKNLNVGGTYELKATPGPGQIFAGWSGGANSGNSSLTFQMQRGLVLQANFKPNPLDPHKGDYNGLFHEPEETGGVRHESSGFINVNLSQKGKFSGKLLLGKSYSFRGAFDHSGGAQVQISRGKGKPALTLNLQLDLTNGTDQIVGTVVNQTEGWVATLLADRANGLPSMAEQGRYTMVIPGVTNDASNPAGDGFGFVNVDASGKLRFKGTLADGSQVNQNVNISKAGQWPLYASVHGGNGSVLSWVTFTNDISSSFQGDLSWIKKAKPGRNYQSGFTNETSAIGSRYSVPASGVSVLEFINGTVTLSGGNLSGPFTNQVTLGSNNIVTVITGTNQLKLTITLPSGLVNGSFVHPDSKATTSIKGVVLQKQSNARGFFLGSNKSGAVRLEGN